MKKYLLLCFLSISNILLSQEIENSKLTYEDIIKVENVSKDELYSRARIWLVNSFKSSKDALQLDDKNAGELVGKAVINYKPSMLQQSEQSKGVIRFTFSIYLKEGQYKYEITNFVHEPFGNSYGTFSVRTITKSEKFPDQNAKQQNLRNKVWVDVKKQIDETIKPLVEDLKDSMAKSKEW